MKKLLIIGIFALLAGYVGYQSTLYYIPNFIYSKFKSKSASTFGEYPNETRVILAPDENSRAVVKPNPDFAYVSSFYDVSDGPVRLRGQLPDSIYWSVAFYQPNTINFYVKNDLQYGSSDLDIILGKTDPNVENVEFVEAATEEGFMLIRVLVVDKSEENLKRIKNLLGTIEIAPIQTSNNN